MMPTRMRSLAPRMRACEAAAASRKFLRFMVHKFIRCRGGGSTAWRTRRASTTSKKLGAAGPLYILERRKKAPATTAGADRPLESDGLSYSCGKKRRQERPARRATG